MSKAKIIISIVGAVIVIAGVGLGIYLATSKPKTPQKSDAKTQAGLPNTPTPQELKGDLTYKDESGFSFTYPTSFTPKDITPDDNSYYSMVSLSKLGQQITITLKDTTYKNIDEWLSKDSAVPKDAKLYGATNLASLSAKQYSSSNKLYTVSVEKGILYLIEGPKDGGTWENVFEVVNDSFSIGNSASAKTSGQTEGKDNTIYEEEIVE